jgi:competence protein ComEC
MRFLNSQIKIAFFICLAIIVASVIQIYLYGSWKEDEISVWIFDVGQGDSIFIDAHIDILIDGGPTSVIIEKLTEVLPFWDRTIDFIISTHPHADHLTGLIDVLRRYVVTTIYTSGQDYQTGAYDIFKDLSASQVDSMSVGDSIKLQQDVSIKTIWPMTDFEGKTLDDPNDGSIVLLINCFDTKILLTSDIGIDEEKAIIDSVGDIDVLKVGHQGSNTSSSEEFLRAIDPEVAVISVCENDYGHPSNKVINRLDKVGAVVYRTDVDGDVRIMCSKDGYEIKLYK